MGAFSTGGGTTRGRRGSDMEPWIGVSLGILRRVDGDEDLASRVLAMVVLEKTTGGARGLLRRRGGRRELLWFGSSWYLFKVQMTG